MNILEGVSTRMTRVAVIHTAPQFLDMEATLTKIRVMTASAVDGGAELVVFGESFIPGFPLWNMVHAPIDQHEFYRQVFENAVTVPGATVEQLAELSAMHNVILSIGVTEKARTSTASMWNTNLIFGSNGALINHRRKLVATWAEKLTWAMGDAAGLEVLPTGVGRIGMLICGENFNTLARYALIAGGEQIHLASYPPAWPVSRGLGGYNITEAIRVRAAAHCMEGKVFSVVAGCLLDDYAIDIISGGSPEIDQLLRNGPQGASMILGPGGECLAGPLVGQEGILFADLDLQEIVGQKELHDLAGHYNRSDVFRLSIDRSRHEILIAEREAQGFSPLQTHTDGSHREAGVGAPVAGQQDVVRGSVVVN